MRICLSFFIAAAITGPLLSQERKAPPTFECRWATGPIEIDGKADETAWHQAELIDKFGQSWLKQNARPPQTATKARLLWDRDNLYFSAELEDHDLFADILEHDGRTWFNDVFEMFFRPDDGKPAYYEFQVNAAGTMLDIYFQRKGIPFDQAKIDGDFHWKAAVVRRGTLDNRTDRDEGWTVEGRIPWDDFSRTGGRPAEGDLWRFALCRYDYTLNEKPELSSSAPLTQPSFHQLEDYARLKFVGMKTGAAQPGIPQHSRVATSKVIGSPDPPLPYRPSRAFPNLKLTFPISLDLIPGTNQFLVIAQDKPYGPSVIFRFTDDSTVAEPEKLLTTPVNGTAYGICFHPRFADNGYLYIGWNGVLADTNQPAAPVKDQPRGGSKRTYATRYTMDRQTLKIDSDSALHVISWESNGHNGGDLEFGLDGMLYITSGDGTSDSDTNLRGQDLTQMTSKVLRIDVDHPADGKNYGVPPDNPFVGQEGVVPETWAYGLRNPWRLAVDPKTGHIWVGNNGQDLWEQVYFVRKADNFGWSVYEGSHLFYANRTMGPHPLTPPAAEHHHSEARSMTGGVVYYGSKLPELYGAYIYGDHSTGRIWGIRHDGTRITWHKLLADTTFNITGFAIDSHGELLVADHRGNGDGGYYYLEPLPSKREGEAPAEPAIRFPRTLSESGLFTNVKQHAVQPGVVPYSVNSPLWSDGAFKERFFAIPESAPADFKIDLSKRNGWDFPEETVLVKSFALEQTEGQEKSRRWIETRFLTKQDGEWAGYSYLWNDEQTDAELVAAEGLDRDYKIKVPVSSEHPDGIRTQKWHYPSRVECMVCHSRAANFVLGLSTAQTNKEHDYGGVSEHQFRVFEQLDLVKSRGGKQASSVDPSKFAKLANPYDESEPLEARARSYLHANCSICHMQAGGGNAQMDLESSAQPRKFNAIDVLPLHHTFGIDDARLIAPGHPERSVLLYRMAHRGEGSGQMPQLATSLVDERAVKLFEAWIRNVQPEN